MSSVAIYTVKAEPKRGFMPNEIIIGFEDISHQTLSHIEKSGGTVLEQFPALSAVTVKVPSSMENAFIIAMKGKPGVRYVERNIIFEAVDTPNDPYWDYQWGMRIIQADDAWDIYEGSTSVTVAIVDTGIEYTHDDLSDHYIAQGYDWANNDNDPMDDNGHGTHCAGIAAAVTDNGIGVAGVAQVSLMAEKVLGAGGSGYADDVADGIVHAADAGADVISMSLGSYSSSSLIKDACEYAWNKGCIIVAAAGNDNRRRRLYPAAYDTVISVAATNRYDGKASYSNYGSSIELSAPGGDGSAYEDWILSTYLDNWYAWAYGTSMATPHVSGLAALVWSYESSLTNQELREHLRDTSDDLGGSGWDKYFGYGRINAYRALSELGPVDSPPTCTIVDPEDGQIVGGEYRVEVDAADDNEVSMVELAIDSGSWIDITSNFDGTHYYYDWDTTTVSDGSHTLDARANDNAGQATYASQITVTVDNVNDPPVADAGPDQSAYVGDTVNFDGSGSYDPDGTIVEYFWDFGDGTNATGVVVEHAYATDGIYTVNLIVTDDDGATDSDTAEVTVTEAPATETFTFTGTVAPRGENRHTVPISSSGAASMHVRLTWNGWGDLRLRIYDPDGALVAEVDESSWRNKVEEITIENLEAGNWEVAAYSDSRWSSTSYTIEVTVNY